jgi:hypothetical protein
MVLLAFGLWVTSGRLFVGETCRAHGKEAGNQMIQSCSSISLGLSEKHFSILIFSFSP